MSLKLVPVLFTVFVLLAPLKALAKDPLAPIVDKVLQLMDLDDKKLYAKGRRIQVHYVKPRGAGTNHRALGRRAQ